MRPGIGLMVALSAAAALPGALADGAVAVPNGGMEKVLAGISLPDLWYAYLGTGAQGSVELDRTVAHTGSNSVRLSSQGPAQPGAFVMLASPGFPVQPETTYNLECFVKGKGVGKVLLRVDAGDAEARKGQPLPTGDYDWREATLTVTTPPGCGGMAVQLVAEGPTEALWVDDVSISVAKLQPARKARPARPRLSEAVAKHGSVFSVLDYGASPLKTDNTAAVQKALDACGAEGGGVVQIPAGTYRFTGTLRMASNNVWLRGVGRSATCLVFDNGGADGIVVGNRIPATPPIAAAQLACNKVTDVYIGHGTKAAGRTVAVINHADFILEKVTIDHCVVGVYAERINNVVLRDVVIVADNAGASDKPAVPWSSWVGVWWDTPPNPNDPSSRSDVLYFDNVCVQLNAAPGTGVLWDGMTNTFIINYANVLHGKYGFRVINSRGNKQNLVPQFLNAFAMLVEGADTCVSIETGYEFKFACCDFDMCQQHTMQVLPDPATGATGAVQINNCRIGNCRKSAIYADGKDVLIANTQIFTTSLAGKGQHPAISIGPHAQDVSISNVRLEESIGTRLASYGVSIEAGARNIQIDNVNATNVNTAAIEDKGAINLTVGKVVEPGGTGRAQADAATTFATPAEGGTLAAAAGTSRLVMTPAAEIQLLTIGLPPAPVNGQLFQVSAVAQPVEGITWQGPVLGAPGAIAAGHTAIFQYSAAAKQWLCIEK